MYNQMKKSTQPAKRAYKSSHRESATLRTRERIVDCAYKLLRENRGAERFSLEAVAKKAGITRPTIYKGFGSRRHLLEAVLDLISDKGGLEKILSAILQTDPTQALMEIVSIFCKFWGTDTTTLVCLHAAGSFDKDFEQSLIMRNERRRTILSVLAGKICNQEQQHSRDLNRVVQTLFALTSLGFYQGLASHNSGTEIIGIVQELCLHVVRPLHIASPDKN
jgi:AcrR family transcriptional regulator